MSHNSTKIISIAATFTAEPLSPSLSLILEHVGLSLELRFAPTTSYSSNYSQSQVFLQTISINLILIRIEDFLTSEEVSWVSERPQYDRISYDLAHIPYSRQYYSSFGLAIARKVHAILVPAHKVLVFDCDNTLWRGVVGEDGVKGISISPAFAQLQKFAVNAHLQRALVYLVSKNVELDVSEVTREAL